jgi:DNA-binding GntR family transcriptional regulator
MTPADVTPPAHVRVASAIARDIRDGTLAPGTRLPSEAQLAEVHNVARPIVRLALDRLRRQLLVTTSASRGTFVRREPEPVVRTSTRYDRRRGGPTSPWARDAAKLGLDPDWKPETQQVVASEVIASRLHLQAGAPVMRTEYWYLLNGHRSQHALSWEPAAMVADSPIRLPEAGPLAGAGVIARFDSIGKRIDRITELLHARPSTDDEQRAFDIEPDVWVVVIERTHWVDQTPAETCDITIPADRWHSEFEVPVRG